MSHRRGQSSEDTPCRSSDDSVLTGDDFSSCRSGRQPLLSRELAFSQLRASLSPVFSAKDISAFCSLSYAQTHTHILYIQKRALVYSYSNTKQCGHSEQFLFNPITKKHIKNIFYRNMSRKMCMSTKPVRNPHPGH